MASGSMTRLETGPFSVSKNGAGDILYTVLSLTYVDFI